MSFLEPIIAILIGTATGALAMAIKKNASARAFLKYGPVVKRAYDIIDPILDQNLNKWDGSQIDKAFELAIDAAADGSLSPTEIKKLAFFMAEAWLPQKAADKVRKLESATSPAPEMLKAAKIASAVNSISS